MPSDESLIETTPLVSVALITYNHEPFIAQAIDSVLAQETDFPLELVIGDDCSTDGTRELVQRYTKAHPDLIRLVRHEQNCGMHANLEATIGACRGRFVALLEGDDFWCHPRKLARQVEQLQRRPELAASYHSVQPVDRHGEPLPLWEALEEPVDQIFDGLLEYCPVLTCSVMFRRAALPSFPAWACDLPMADWALFLTIARGGAFGGLAEKMAAYRVHSGGAWSLASPEAKVRGLAAAYGTFARQYGRGARWTIARAMYQRLVDSVRHMEDSGGDRIAVRMLLEDVLMRCARLGKLPEMSVARWWFRLRFPSLSDGLRQSGRSLLRRDSLK